MANSINEDNGMALAYPNHSKKRSLESGTRMMSHIRLGGLALVLLLFTACNSLVGGVIGTADRIDDARESRRLASIYGQSVARYKAMADRGDPKGLYYMAFVHAFEHRNDRNDPTGDAQTVKRMYEEAIARGSNDAKVALGNMLICGATGILWTTACFPNIGLPEVERDPFHGLELLKEAAEKSCSVTEPLIGLDQCREREASIATKIRIIYRDGKGGIPKDPKQEAYWRDQESVCEQKIDEINRQRRCYQ
ncbi:hypothetical protein [Oryzomicrobium sp.]|uniref:hypothetical protein n=1 Tax=Oryzomicrobium sp. TaxID=1911578 RepID=UPI0025D2B650|nr:hypothetical protein [Oryzomicrobium sp.]MCE1242904.1 hypothetical protein [Oryzomicrobium sp.]